MTENKKASKATSSQQRQDDLSLIDTLAKSLSKNNLDATSRNNIQERLVDALLRSNQIYKAITLLSADLNNNKIPASIRASIRDRLVELYLKEKKPNQAITLLREEIKAEGTRALTRAEDRQQIADIYLKNGNQKKAIAILRQGLDDNHLDEALTAEMNIALAEVLIDAKESQEAIVVLQGALEEASTGWVEDQISESLAEILLRNGKREEGEALAQVVKNNHRQREEFRQMQERIDGKIEHLSQTRPDFWGATNNPQAKTKKRRQRKSPKPRR